MKTKLCLVLFLLATQLSVAQENTFDDVAIRGFSGLQPLGDNGYYYACFSAKNETKGEADFKIAFVDKNFNLVSEKKISISKYSELAGSAAGRSSMLFIFYDLMKRNITYMTFDLEGNLITTRVIPKVKRNLLTPEDYPYVNALGDDFVVVRSDKADKVGYNVERVDKNLKSLSSQTFAPEKKEMEVLDLKMLKDKVYILRQTAATSGNQFNTEVVKHDAATGVEEFAYNLYDGTHSGYPTFLQVSEEGKIYTAGIYFEGTKTDNTDSEGFFYLQLTNDGQRVAYEKHDWAEVKKFTKEKGTSAFWGGETKIIIQDIVLKPDNSLSVIGEAFRKSKPGKAGEEGKKLVSLKKFTPTLGSLTGTDPASQADWAYTIMDLNIFEFDPQGNFVNARKIFKKDQIIYVKSARKVRGLSMALELKRNGYFGYKYHITDNDKQYLVTNRVEEKGGLVKIPKKYVFFIPLESFGIEEAGSVEVRTPTVTAEKKGFLNDVASAAATLAIGSESFYNTTDQTNDVSFYNFDAANGSFYNKGDLVFYNFNTVDRTLRVWKDKIPKK